MSKEPYQTPIVIYHGDLYSTQSHKYLARFVDGLVHCASERVFEFLRLNVKVKKGKNGR